MVGIAAPLFDINGAMALPILAESKMANLSQRVSVSDTLSGGSVVKTRGYYDTNRNLQVFVKPDKTDEDQLFYLFKLYPYLYLSTSDGFYLVVIGQMVKTEDTMELTITIKEKLS